MKLPSQQATRIGFSSPLVSQNVITGAQVGCPGGSISIGGSASAQIIGNVIAFNNGGSGGGGIDLFAAGTPTIRSNIIIGNTSFNAGGGISMVNNSDANIIQNLITGNSAPQGGGIYGLVPSGARGPLLVNNTIVTNNSANGSGIFIDGFDSQTVVVNNLVVANTGQTALLCGNFASTTPSTLTFNDIFSPGGSAYGGLCTSQTGTNGNISADPLFVAPLSNNYHLRTGSPAIDVGNNAAPTLPPKDIDGDNRIVNATGKPTAIVDMGMDEFSIAEVLTLSNSGLTFGTQGVGTSSTAQSITFRNNGASTANINAVLTGGDFSQTNTCGTSVAVGAHCTVTVTFTPAVRGLRNGILAIMTDASESPQAVVLSGTGTGPVASLSNTSLFFNGQAIGTTSAAQAVVVSNTGDAPLTFTSIVASGDFAIASSGTACSASTSVGAGANCTISITFTPTATGTRTGQVTLADNASGTPQVIQLSGQGLSTGVVSFSPTSLTFPNQFVGTTSAAQMLTLTNTGRGALTILSISVSPSPDFAAPNNCPISPATLAAGAACTFSVTFTPHFPNFETGNIFITDDASVSTSLIALSGTGVASALTLSAPNLSFATQGVGSTSAVQTITATNSIATAVSITSVVASGDFAQTNNCGTTIAASGMCTISVTFTPTVTGTRTGNVTVAFNGVGSPQSASLTGTGISPAAALLFWKLKAAFNDPRTFNGVGTTGVEGAAASLISGKLYVSHGYRQRDTAFLSIYDLATDSWTHGGPTAPDASVPRSEMAGGTALGKHFAIGGRTLPNADNEQFDPSTTLWTKKAPMSVARGGVGAASFNNKIYAIGGRIGGTYGVPPILNLVEVYDPAADAWTTLAPLPVAVSDDYATVALSGKIYVFGGTNNIGPGTTNLVQIYDITSNTWSAGASMPTARGAAMAGVIGSKIAVFGGVDASLMDLSITELYDPIANSWERGPDMISPVSEIAQGVTGDGTQIFAVGSGIFGVSGPTVQALLMRDFSMAPAPGSSSSATITVGQSATYTLGLTGMNGFSGTVTASCSNAPATTNCTVSPSSLIVGASPSNFTVTVATTARSLVGPPKFWIPAKEMRLGLPLSVWLLTLALMLFLTSWLRQNARLGLGILILLALLWTGCSGGGNGSTPAVSTGGTPTGTYALTVTATSGIVSHSTTLTLTVQ